MREIHRPGMSRRNARYRGPRESMKYLSDTYERIHDITLVGQANSATQGLLEKEVLRLMDENRALHHQVRFIETQINLISQHIKEAM